MFPKILSLIDAAVSEELRQKQTYKLTDILLLYKKDTLCHILQKRPKYESNLHISKYYKGFIFSQIVIDWKYFVFIVFRNISYFLSMI